MQRVRLAVLAAAVIAAIAVFALFRSTPGADAPGSGRDAAPGPAPKSASPSVAPGPIRFIIAGCADDRIYPEPCADYPCGGLFSLAALNRSLTPEKETAVSVFMGDLIHVGGELGSGAAAYLYGAALSECGVKIVAAGPSELSYGSAFCRSFLSVQKYPALCANAVDPSGAPVLKGYSLLDSAQGAILVISTADLSVQDEITAGGNDLRLVSPSEAAAEALRRGREAAAKVDRPIAAAVLLHHGTPEQTVALVRQVPGFAFAVAARGGDLPLEDPLDGGGTPVFASGRGLRFAWVLTTDGGTLRRWSLVRLGMMLLADGSPLDPMLAENAVITRDEVFTTVATAKDDRRIDHADGRYVGAQACARCHAEQVGEHGASAHGRRPAAFKEIALGRLQCIGCHTTGAFYRTGWRGKDDTSDLGAVSCEACHGPGSAHVESQDKPYGRNAITRCRGCHTPDRDAAFSAEDLWKRWGHGARR
ncbi:MAG: hypothetical protein K8T90_08265 [Planctomycetes bacterium]|nr:hypothetical protein [Planctomycetota bacterium]